MNLKINNQAEKIRSQKDKLQGKKKIKNNN